MWIYGILQVMYIYIDQIHEVVHAFTVRMYKKFL